MVHLPHFWVLLLYLMLCLFICAINNFNHTRQTFKSEENEAEANRESAVISLKA